MAVDDGRRQVNLWGVEHSTLAHKWKSRFATRNRWETLAYPNPTVVEKRGHRWQKRKGEGGANTRRNQRTRECGLRAFKCSPRSVVCGWVGR